MKVKEIYEELEKIIPSMLSMEWDNDGLMVNGDPEKEVVRALVALDATAEVIDYAIDNAFDLIVTHHPLIFKKLACVNAEDVIAKKVVKCIKYGITVMSFHTRLDILDGGVNDALAYVLGLNNIQKYGELVRVGELSSPMQADEFADFVREALSCDYVNCVGQHMVRRVAVAGGDGKDHYIDALNTEADVYVTGSLSYNMMVEAAEQKMNVVEAGHFYTEYPVCKVLANTLGDMGLEAEVYYSNPISTFFSDNFVD
ncbi:MAG: Nif3-like dinuclear metal center hexameric protein [Clostridiales bacterium]|nr:Nif3-like dinuclear metal center hexameric protein [Clostridiales bacterium]